MVPGSRYVRCDNQTTTTCALWLYVLLEDAGCLGLSGALLKQRESYHLVGKHTSASVLTGKESQAMCGRQNFKMVSKRFTPWGYSCDYLPHIWAKGRLSKQVESTHRSPLHAEFSQAAGRRKSQRGSEGRRALTGLTGLKTEGAAWESGLPGLGWVPAASQQGNGNLSPTPPQN